MDVQNISAYILYGVGLFIEIRKKPRERGRSVESQAQICFVHKPEHAMLNKIRDQRKNEMEQLYHDEGYALVGAAMEVYNEMGPGFLEDVYQECFELELAARNIPFQAQLPLNLWYKGMQLKKGYKPDLLVFDSIIVELKAEKTLTGRDESQLLNYLKGGRKKVGYLFNFGHETDLQFKRMVF